MNDDMRDEPGRKAALALTVLVHGALVAALFLGVQWKRSVPEAMEVELWSPTVQPAKAPPPPKAGSRLVQLGISLGALDGAARGKFRIKPNVQGVLVAAVAPGSPAADKNLRPGDVIVEVQGSPVKTPREVTARIEADSKAGKKVELMLINRGGDLTYIGLPLK